MAALDQAQTPALICSVVREDLGATVRLRGRVVGQEDTQGTYSFQISKAGPAGSTSVNQGGQFSALSNAETFVGLATLSVERGASYTAHLSLRIGSQDYRCESHTGGRHE
jgi:hypothetical protein